MFRLFGVGKPAALAAENVGEAWLREHEARTGDGERAGTRPGWSLVLRSPFRPWGDATSWLGGLPVAPPATEWPRNDRGEALHFMAQVDLGALQPEPLTGALPPGLPRSGALAVFAGLDAARVLVLPEAASAAQMEPPGDLAPLSEIDLGSREKVLPRWPVDPVPFVDDGDDPPAAFARPRDDPSTWVATWGMAVEDVDFVLRTLAVASDLRSLSDFHLQSRIASEDFRQMMVLLDQWRARAAASDPGAPVDAEALRDLLSLRRKMALGLSAPPLVTALRADPQDIWYGIRAMHRAGVLPQDGVGVPQGLRAWIEDKVTGWRGHRLFGLVTGLEFNSEDRRGLDPLLSLKSDRLLGNEREHTFGSSIWFPRADLEAGRYDRSLLIQHYRG